MEILAMAGSSGNVATQRLLANQPALLLSKRSLSYGDVRPRHCAAANVCCSDGRRHVPAGGAAPIQPDQLGQRRFWSTAAAAAETTAAIKEGQRRRGLSSAHNVHCWRVPPHDYCPRFWAVHSWHWKRNYSFYFYIDSFTWVQHQFRNITDIAINCSVMHQMVK